MGRIKGSKNKGKVKAKAATKAPKDPRIQEIFEEEIEYMCPVRGLVKQKVKVRKFKPLSSQVLQPIAAGDPLADIESKDDGLSIYSEDEPET
jgi:hypothetical protein